MQSATVAAPLPPAEVHSVPTSDGTAVRLTRYKFGTKGPLVLAPGYGNAARAFAIDTVPKNWVQYLGEHGYDVWLLDYRASPDLPSSFTQFTVDDIAMRDWPAAVDTIRRETGQDEIQAMGHCVGGLSLFMAIGGGMQGLRSATFSSLAGHPIPTPGNQARAWAHMATLFKLPINFITGEHNKMFVPKGLQRTYDTLRRANGPQDYTHHVIKDYAHLDLWLGTNAERDVWPTALAELEKHN